MPGFLGLTLIIIAILYGGAEKQPSHPEENSPSFHELEHADFIRIPTLESIQKTPHGSFPRNGGGRFRNFSFISLLPQTSLYHRLVLTAPTTPLVENPPVENVTPGESQSFAVAETNLRRQAKPASTVNSSMWSPKEK